MLALEPLQSLELSSPKGDTSLAGELSYQLFQFHHCRRRSVIKRDLNDDRAAGVKFMKKAAKSQ